MTEKSTRKYSQRYRPSWKNDQRFKGWLQSVPGDASKARCKVCGNSFQAHMKSVIGHSLSKKHVDNTKSSTSKSQRSIKNAMRPIERDPVKIAELRIAVYIAEHASALSVDHLGELLPKLDMKPCTLQDFRMHHTKCARLQKYVITPSFAVKLRNEIGDQFF
ncbi:uncharacterized protein LOC143023737 isoform X2 [Oratosquilla oratoria]|uniref:uncharacterized protein LOC143023737 isoform X2 n=1 Tax=Oratosquilla oratoria TaxID=337810 RepID=UPI003F772307